MDIVPDELFFRLFFAGLISFSDSSLSFAIANIFRFALQGFPFIENNRLHLLYLILLPQNIISCVVSQLLHYKSGYGNFIKIEEHWV